VEKRDRYKKCVSDSRARRDEDDRKKGGLNTTFRLTKEVLKKSDDSWDDIRWK